jgi:hypothetical protein
VIVVFVVIVEADLGQKERGMMQKAKCWSWKQKMNQDAERGRFTVRSSSLKVVRKSRAVRKVMLMSVEK